MQSSLSKKEQKQLRQLKTGTHTINFAKACGQINTINTIVTEITGINRNTCNQLKVNTGAHIQSKLSTEKTYSKVQMKGK